MFPFYLCFLCSPQIICYIQDKTKSATLCFANSSVQHLIQTWNWKTGLFFMPLLAKAKSKSLLLDEWCISNNYTSRIWGLCSCSWKSLAWDWIWDEGLDPCISCMFLGFPVEDGLEKEWMMAAWRGSWWESCWLPTLRLMSGSAEPLLCSSHQAWSEDLSLYHQTINQVSGGGCLVLYCLHHYLRRDACKQNCSFLVF